jgi:hypothetical protein
MTVEMRRAGSLPPLLGDVLLRDLQPGSDAPIGWTAIGQGTQRQCYRIYTGCETFAPTDMVVTPPPLTDAGTRAEAPVVT